MGVPLQRNPNGSLAGGNGGGLPMAPQQPQLTPEQSATVLNPGTTYETTLGAYTSGANAWHPIDPRNYQYGRSATGADEAVKQSQNTGESAFGTGNNLLSMDLGYAQDARNRAAPTGDFSAQNTALFQAQGYGQQALNYGQQLAGLEATQGPSAAQAQLNTGTNQALSSQLALARSGRGFGGNAAAMGQAQNNVAGIQANQANQAAMLRAQEDAAWRARQAANYGNAAGIAGSVAGLTQNAGQQYGQQANSNLSAALQTQAQNDQTALGYAGQGATAYGQGVAQDLAAQQLQNNIRMAEMTGGAGAEDRALRAWAAEQGFKLEQNAADAQQRGALYSGIGAVGGGLIGAFTGGPGGAALGASLGGAGGKALASG